MRLTNLISLRRPASIPLEPEDIFSSSLGGIFTDDLQNQHGDNADTTIVYKNAKYGDLEFKTADVNGEDQRTKYAHYLWNSGVLMGELVSGRAEPNKIEEDEDAWETGEWWLGKDEEKFWSVQGETVIELGAGGLG